MHPTAKGEAGVAFDVFTGGIEPGGLRSKDEIRILICYLLSSVSVPLSREDILSIMQENGFANYFEVTDSLAELTENGNLICSGDQPPLYTAAPQGRMISKQLDTAVPLSVREKAVAAALNLLARAKREQENKVEIVKNSAGYTVTCHVSGGEVELMSFSLYAPDQNQAHMIKQNFHRSPELVYQVMLLLMTGQVEQIPAVIKRATT